MTFNYLQRQRKNNFKTDCCFFSFHFYFSILFILDYYSHYCVSLITDRTFPSVQFSGPVLLYLCTLFLFPPITAELDSEHAQKVPEVESGQQQVKLKDRQKFFEEAFQQDMEHYLSTSYLQIAERRGERNIHRERSEGRNKSTHMYCL